MGFKMMFASLEDKTNGMTGYMGGPVSEGDVQTAICKLKLMMVSKITVNERDGCSRVYHCINRQGGAMGVDGDWDCDWGRTRGINGVQSYRRERVKCA